MKGGGESRCRASTCRPARYYLSPSLAGAITHWISFRRGSEKAGPPKATAPARACLQRAPSADEPLSHHQRIRAGKASDALGYLVMPTRTEALPGCGTPAGAASSRETARPDTGAKGAGIGAEMGEAAGGNATHGAAGDWHRGNLTQSHGGEQQRRWQEAQASGGRVGELSDAGDSWLPASATE